MIRVLIVDDHPFVRAQLKAAMSDVDGITVVGECADGSEVLIMAALVQPDVVLMDVRMRRTSGIVATIQLMAARPASRVMMLTGSPSSRAIADAASAGAVGFLTKGTGTTGLLDAVRTVAAGGTCWPDDATGIVLQAQGN